MAEKEYIERGALMKKIFPYGHIVDQRNYSINAASIQKAIQDAPAADVVEVVRCKDCRHCGTSLCAMDTYGFDVVEEGFCSYGERETV